MSHTRFPHISELNSFFSSLKWLRRHVGGWLALVLAPAKKGAAGGAEGGAEGAMIAQWEARLRFFFMQSLASLRISELFEMIKERGPF